jgi:hypothetical protein
MGHVYMCGICGRSERSFSTPIPASAHHDIGPSQRGSGRLRLSGTRLVGRKREGGWSHVRVRPKHRAGTTMSRRTVTGASSPGLSWVETRPGRTMDSPGPAVGTQCGGPKAPERLTAGSAGCCCCDCSWSRASRKEVASAAGCRLERSASPDRMNARFGRALLYSTIRASRGRSVAGAAGARL